MNAERTDGPAATRAHDGLPLALVGACGLVLGGCLWVSAPEAPEPGAPAAEIRAFTEANLDRTTLAVLAGMVAFAALILFTVALWRLAAVRGLGQGIAAVTLLVSGTLTALWLGVTAAVDLIPVVAADDAGTLSAYSDQTLLTLDLVDRFGETFGDVSTVPRGLFLVCAGLLIVRHKVLPRWTGYPALVIGVASLIGIVVIGLFGLALWMLVVGVTSVVMLTAQWSRSRRGEKVASAPRTANG
jgi:Domain of unknown function (DUF4386)